MKRLTRGEFDATFTNPMRPLGAGTQAPFDYWGYFDEIPLGDFRGVDCRGRRVSNVYQTSGQRYQHVLIESNRESTFMVLVLTVPEKVVYGHHLLEVAPG
ncbi:MAG: hypothetical protein AAF581_02310 [Planctomycetota bacterium]